MKLNGEPVNFSKYGKTFQEKLCMVILDDRAFADQIEEVLDVNFLELNYLKCFLNKVFDYRKKYEVHPSRDIMKTILRSELDNENELTSKQVREYYVRSQITAVTDIEYIKDTALDFCKKQNLKSAMVKSIGLLQNSSFDEISQVINDSRGHTLASASTLDPEIKSAVDGKTKGTKSELVGSLVAKRALSQGIKQVAFDRGGFKYHGRVKALAEAARREGLKF